jgi:carbon monoxide dehydrogenase subunit G
MKTTKTLSAILFVSLFMGVSTLFAGCRLGVPKGDGNIVKQERKISSFNGIDISGAFNIYLKQGDAESVTLEADENIMQYIRTEVKDGILNVGLKESHYHNTGKINVYITIKGLKSIDLSGAVDLQTQNKLSLSDLSIDVSGAADTRLEMAVQKLTIDGSGASKMSFTGSATEVSMDLSGASEIFAFDMPAESYTISLSGAGTAEINVTKKLNAEISGAGTIRYKGSPSEISQDLSGAGSIKKVQ